MSFGVYLTTAAALTLVSISYCTEAPALYCTASSSGLCMEIWSVYFFSRAAWKNDSRHKFFAEIFIGAVLGALAFGCKPTIALANILILPLVPKILGKDDLRKILPTLTLPYFVIGAALMPYNYLRFDSVFEFGASYQLTVTDQRNYGNFFDVFDWSRFAGEFLRNFFGVATNLILLDNKPPGAFRYIIFWLPIFLLKKDIRAALSENKLIGVIIALIFTPILISAIQIQWTPSLIERYRLEIYWVLSLLSFITIGFLSEKTSTARKIFFNFGVCLLSIVTIFQCLNLFFIPNDFNFAMVYPELRPTILKIISFGLI